MNYLKSCADRIFPTTYLPIGFARWREIVETNHHRAVMPPSCLDSSSSGHKFSSRF